MKDSKEAKVMSLWIIKLSQSTKMKNQRREWLLQKVQRWLLMQMTKTAVASAVTEMNIVRPSSTRRIA